MRQQSPCCRISFLAMLFQIRYDFAMILAISIIIGLTIPVGFLAFLRTYDLHKTAKFNRNLISLACGVGAYFIAAQINPAMQRAGWVTWDQVERFTAPVVEEILKALILIYLVSRAEFNYIVDGALYGFGAGIGFAIIENVQYVNNNIENALIVAILRVFSTNLMHATGSGLIGTALAYHRGSDKDKKRQGLFIIAGGFLVAISFHMVFNNIVSTMADTRVSAGLLFGFAIGYGVLGAFLIWYAIRRGMSTQKEWVGEKLGAQDRVSQQEVRAATNIEKIVDQLIRPFQESFGDAKVPLVRSMIYKQIEIGIKRKLIEKTPNPSKRMEIEAIIDTLGREMNQLRNEIGTYHMMFVRTVYLDQDFAVWDKINARIAENSTGQKGGGLWDTTTARIRQSKPREEDKP